MSQAKIIRRTKKAETDFSINEDKETPAPKTFTEKRKLTTATKIAESEIYMRNYQWQGAREDFPHEPTLRCVDKYYPYAVGGPLLVDEPNHPREIEASKRKAEILKKRGYRFLYLTREMSEQDAYQILNGVS